MKNFRFMKPFWQFIFGFFSGVPLALSGSTLQAWLSLSGTSLIVIGFVTWLGQPYAYKFLWAPFFDRYWPPFLGKRIGWIFLIQLFLSLVLLILSGFNPKFHLGLIFVFSGILAFLSASQDIEIDAYRTEILTPSERGLGASFTNIGYRLGLIFSGALGLVIAQYWGWASLYRFMASALLVGSIFTLLSPKISLPSPEKRPSLWKPFQELSDRFSWTVLLGLFFFLMLYKLGDALVFSLSSNFLLKTLHFSLVQVAMANKTVGILASIGGGLVGGVALIWLSLWRSLWMFGLLQGLSNLGFWWLSVHHPSVSTMMIVIGVDQFCSGLSTVALMAFLMGLCHPNYSATQYALFSAIVALSRIYVGPLSGFAVELWGWPIFFFVSFLFSFPALAFLPWIHRRIKPFSPCLNGIKPL